MNITRADGSSETTEFKEASASFIVNLEDVPHLTLDQRITQLNELADSMAAQMSQHLFATLNDTLEKANRVTNAQGKPFSVETVFEALDSIQVDFDDEGNPANLSMVVGSALKESAQEAHRKIESDPELRKRFSELMSKKRMEWRDREAVRKLVG